MEILGLEIEGLPGTDLIQETFLFKPLNFDETLALAGLCTDRAVGKGEVIIEEGELGSALYMVERGSVKVVKGEGKQAEELAVLGKGELFGEMSLIEDVLTSATVMANEDSVLLLITRDKFEKLIEENREIAFKVYKAFCLTLSERLRKTSEELTRLKQKGTSNPPSSRKTSAGKCSPPVKKKTAKKAAGKKKAVSKKK